MSDLFRLSACELAARIAKREISAREVIDAHIARIEAVNPALNAVVTSLFDEARHAARQADEQQAQGKPLGPLHGVPVTIKECFHVRGTSSTLGLTTGVQRVQSADGALVAKLKAAGAIVLGKTNLPQLMLLHESVNPVYGRTKNPWNVDRTCGGSSGGEGAIIAAGGSACGLGSDLGGSIRIPAHFCGIAGLKPSSRRLTKDGCTTNLRGLEVLQWQPGPLARHVADLDLMLRVLAEGNEQTTWADVAPARLRSSSDVSITGLRVAFWEETNTFVYAPAVKRAVREAVAALQRRGAIVEPLAPPKISEAVFLYTALLAADGGAGSERQLRGSKVDAEIAKLMLVGRIPKWLRSWVAWAVDKTHAQYKAGLIRTARPRSADEFWQLTYRTQAFCRQFLDDFSQRFDALVLPAYALPAPRHGQAVDLIPAASDTLFINLLGVPAGVVPVTRVRSDEESNRTASRELASRTAAAAEQGSAGLPIGVQVVSHFWREDIVLAVMQAIESECRSGADFPLTPVTP